MIFAIENFSLSFLLHFVMANMSEQKHYFMSSGGISLLSYHRVNRIIDGIVVLKM